MALATRARRKGNTKVAIEKFREILDIDPKAGELVNEGLKLLEEDKGAKAQKSFEEAIATDKDYADAYYKLGNYLHGKKKWDDSIKNFKKAVELDPDEPAYYYGLGNSQYKLAFKNFIIVKGGLENKKK